jgi:hypothetical protein
VCLPYGVATELNKQPVKRFCPSCSDVYNVTDDDLAKVDSTFFGAAGLTLFLQKYPDVVPAVDPELCVPKNFDVKISEDLDEPHEDSSTT